MRPVRHAHLLLLLPLLLAVPRALSAEPLRPGYQRGGAERVAAPATRPSVPPPAALIPDEPEIAVASPGVVRSRSGASRRDDGQRHEPVLGRALRDAAREAAAWTAVRVVDRSGRRDYYRVGFYHGLHAALDDARLGQRDHAEGRRNGWLDPAARLAGADIGLAAAETEAWHFAEKQVVDQFTDLTREPVYAPRHVPPAFAPVSPELALPSLRGVLADYPLDRFALLSPHYRGHLVDWSYDPWRLVQCDDVSELYGTGWMDADAAFRLWESDARRSRAYRRLRDPEQRAAFRTLFRAAFSRRLARLYEDEMQRVHDHGLDDGWAYGAFVHRELDYRKGYTQAFRRAVEDAAARRFARSYPTVYGAAYRELFDGWSTSARPAIASVRLVDGNGDGVFEPGESLFATYELINYGGADGSFGVQLEGDVLDRSASISERLPARSVTAGRNKLEARVEPRTGARSWRSLRFRVAGAEQELRFWVSYPLEIQRESVSIARDNLAGRVRLRVEVENTSRLPVNGELRLNADGTSLRDRRIESLGPGDRVTAVFDVDRLDPLRLVGGRVELRVTAASADVTHDRIVEALPETATDLGSSDLLGLLLLLAGDQAATSADIEAARSLLLMRLRADWRDAVRAWGNPYKKDHKQDGRSTALGDLVQTYREHGGSLPRGEVFGGLSDEIHDLSGDLPGWHPRLRKYVRRLATALP